ncbi:UNVERIFIED_CONTAM: hypothetical protein K2H54_001827 [Gekko kuhli]
MSGEDGEVPTTAADGTVTEQWTTAAPVMTAKSKGAEGGAQIRDSWALLAIWAEPTWVMTPNLRFERLAYDSVQSHYRCSFRDDQECLHVVEDTGVECLCREFRGEAEEIRQEMQSMMLDIPGKSSGILDRPKMELEGCHRPLCKCPRLLSLHPSRSCWPGWAAQAACSTSNSRAAHDALEATFNGTQEKLAFFLLQA